MGLEGRAELWCGVFAAAHGVDDRVVRATG